MSRTENRIAVLAFDLRRFEQCSFHVMLIPCWGTRRGRLARGAIQELKIAIAQFALQEFAYGAARQFNDDADVRQPLGFSEL